MIEPQSHVERSAAWRAAFDLTEKQTSLIVALIAAQNLGYDGATSRELESILSRETAHRTGDLQRMRLIEVLGFSGAREKVFRATAVSYRRLGLPVPELPPILETAPQRADEMQARYVARQRAQRAERDRRQRRSA